jgi:hypothetical protein
VIVEITVNGALGELAARAAADTLDVRPRQVLLTPASDVLDVPAVLDGLHVRGVEVLGVREIRARA